MLRSIVSSILSITTAPVLVAGLALAGITGLSACGGEKSSASRAGEICEAACNAANVCLKEQDQKETDCGTECKNAADEAKDVSSACLDKLEAFAHCQESQTKCEDQASKCSSEAKAVGDCISAST